MNQLSLFWGYYFYFYFFTKSGLGAKNNKNPGP